jgi:hypothetical protein
MIVVFGSFLFCPLPPKNLRKTFVNGFIFEESKNRPTPNPDQDIKVTYPSNKVE